MSKESDSKLPNGKHVCWAVADEGETDLAPKITADKDGFPQIKVTLAIAPKPKKGETQGESFASTEQYQTIDPEAPARGSSTTTPYEFAVQFLLNLGGTSRADVERALLEGLESSDQVVRVPGLGSKIAECEISRKQGTRGTFVNVSVFGNRTVDESRATSAAERIRARLAADGAPVGTAPLPASPFAPRGTPIAPPKPSSSKPIASPPASSKPAQEDADIAFP